MRQNLRTSIVIDAQPEQVWEVLTNFNTLKDWSSSFIGLKGDFKKDGQIEVVFKSPFGGSMNLKKQLIVFDPGRSFGWTGVFMLGMKDYHTYKIKPAANGKTELIQEDGLNGGASFLLGSILEKTMKKDYEKFNLELKTYIESNNS
ncbi:SRPBCC domain-containing protein [Membranihabitans marinus]|uniref:SRPBCC domain-containing protein n=1 Tax=Membranihabitans marinus TaxID=1227546 RepID=UPI001F23C7CB|nr:SRPBCC domain-containing protein [Membranihabitans marinus]